MRTYNLVRIVFAFIALVFGAYKGLTELSIAVHEREPSVHTARTFGERYDGAQFVRVEGRIAIEHADVERSTHEAHVESNLGYVYAPIVAETWTPAEPVVVLGTFGPIPLDDVDAWAVDAASRTWVQGQVRPIPLPNADTRFGAANVTPDVVVINDGTEPSITAMVFFLAMMVAGVVLFVHTLRGWLAERTSSSRDQL